MFNNINNRDDCEIILDVRGNTISSITSSFMNEYSIKGISDYLELKKDNILIRYDIVLIDISGLLEKRL